MKVQQGRPGRSGDRGGTQQRIAMPFLVLSVQRLDVRVFARQTINTICCSQCQGRINAKHIIITIYLTSLQVTGYPSTVFTFCKWSNIGGGNGLGIFNELCIVFFLIPCRF